VIEGFPLRSTALAEGGKNGLGLGRMAGPDADVASSAMIVRTAFSLIDLLVSITVMALLIGLLLPSVSRVRESSRRVVCASNLKQDGLAVAMFADDHNGVIPTSVFGDRPNLEQRPDEMMLIHLGEDDASAWEGMGWLVEGGYTTPQTLYCPSHKGRHPYDAYEDDLSALGGAEIVSNYNWRPLASASAFLPKIRSGATLATDGVRTRGDYNHVIGNNMLKADSSVDWMNDSDGFLLKLLPLSDDEGAVVGGRFGVAAVWGLFDSGGPNFQDPNSPFFRGGSADQSSQEPINGQRERDTSKMR
jgi:hypothetical protein